MTGIDWRQQAACRKDPDLWHIDSTTGPALLLTEEARRICNTACPVRQQCLDQILRIETGWGANTRHGIYAGLDGKQRAALDPTPRRKNQAAREAA